MKSAVETKKYNTEELLSGCVALLDEKKSEQIVVLNLSRVNSCFDYFIITTGSSAVHCKAITRDVYNYMSAHGRKTRSKPDMDSPWIILDYDDIVLHVFTDETRNFYQLERLWGDAERVIV